MVAEIASIDQSTLSRSDQITLSMLNHTCSTVSQGVKYGLHCCCVNYFEGVDRMFTLFAMKNMKFDTEEDYEVYFERISLYPKQV